MTICNGRTQKSRSTERNKGGKKADRNRRRKGIKARRKETKEDKGAHVRTNNSMIILGVRCSIEIYQGTIVVRLTVVR